MTNLCRGRHFKLWTMLVKLICSVFALEAINPIDPNVWFYDWFPEGGGQIDTPPPPFIFLKWYKSIKFDTLKPLGSTLIICKQMANLQKSKYLLRNQLLSKNWAKQIAQIEQIIHFWKAITQGIQICKNIFWTWKCANSLSRRLCKNLCKISLKITVQSACFIF